MKNLIYKIVALLPFSSMPAPLTLTRIVEKFDVVERAAYHSRIKMWSSRWPYRRAIRAQYCVNDTDRSDEIRRVTNYWKLLIEDIMEALPASYSYIWHKYRPVILRLMINAEGAPQQYRFSDHEFKRIFPKKRSSLAFILYTRRAKALNNIKTSPLAQSLLGILQQSRTAVRLTEDFTYEFMLDEKFVLHVRRNEKVNSDDVAFPTAASLEAEVLSIRWASTAVAIEQGKEAFRIMKNITTGGTMAILIDQDTRVKSVFVDLFGKPCSTRVGATVLAQSLKMRSSLSSGYGCSDGKQPGR